MNHSPLAREMGIPLARFALAVLLMMAVALLFVGVQFLSASHGVLAAVALVADIPAERQTMLASVLSIVGLVFIALTGRAWWAFEQWLASTKIKAA